VSTRCAQTERAHGASAFLDRPGKGRAAPFPCNENQPDRGSLGASTAAPAPLARFLAAPIPPAFLSVRVAVG